MQTAAQWTRDLYRIFLKRPAPSGGMIAAAHLDILQEAEQTVQRMKREAFVAGAEAYRQFLLSQAQRINPANLVVEQVSGGPRVGIDALSAN